MTFGIIGQRTIFGIVAMLLAVSVISTAIPSAKANPFTTFKTFTFSYSSLTATWTVTKVKCAACSPSDMVQLQASGTGSFADTFSAASSIYSVGQNTGQITITMSIAFTSAQTGETFTYAAVLSCNTVTPDCGELDGSFTV
jgi:hypothetical protein